MYRFCHRDWRGSERMNSGALQRPQFSEKYWISWWSIHVNISFTYLFFKTWHRKEIMLIIFLLIIIKTFLTFLLLLIERNAQLPLMLQENLTKVILSPHAWLKQYPQIARFLVKCGITLPFRKIYVNFYSVFPFTEDPSSWLELVTDTEHGLWHSQHP